MMDNLLELYAERVQAWKKATVRLSYSAIDAKRNAVALYDKLTQLEADNEALRDELNLITCDRWTQREIDAAKWRAQEELALLTEESDD